ncbi:MAG: outer membrane beta-barrel protein [Marinilabiliaceae bacterium]|nr:outer membrane beta-barrel protein [Marinilabiliaceae bacterium]
MATLEEKYKKFCETNTEQPPINMWNRIESSLNNKAANGRIVWMRFLAVAASLTLLISLSLWFWVSNIPQEFDNYLSDNIEIIETDDIQPDANDANNSEIISNDFSPVETPKGKIHISSLLAYQTDNNTKEVGKSENIQNNITTKPIESDHNILIISDEVNSTDRENITPSEEEFPVLKQQSINYYDALFRDPYPTQVNSNKQRAQIEVGGSYSPVYSFRQVSDRNNDALLTTDYPNESGIINNGAGVSLSVKFSGKWAVESGVLYSKMGHKISNPEINNSPFATENDVLILNHVYLYNTMGKANIYPSLISVSDIPSDIPTPPSAFPKVNETPLQSSLEQNLDYLEVPFSFRYYFTDTKFKVSMSAGISANFLVNNSFYLKYNNVKEKIGETEGISNLTMSTHAGISFVAPLFKQFSFQIEPRVNYFLDEINKNHLYKYRPYSFGIYSGVRYQFGK